MAKHFRQFINLLDGGDGDIKDISFKQFALIGIATMAGAVLISCVG